MLRKAWMVIHSDRHLGQIAFPFTAERAPRPRDLGRIEAGAGGESQQQILVAQHMLQHAYEKVGRAGRVANAVVRQSGDREESAKPLRVFRDKGKGLNSQHFGGFRRVPCALLHRFPFAFP